MLSMPGSNQHVLSWEVWSEGSAKFDRTLDAQACQGARCASQRAFPLAVSFMVLMLKVQAPMRKAFYHARQSSLAAAGLQKRRLGHPLAATRSYFFWFLASDAESFPLVFRGFFSRWPFSRRCQWHTSVFYAFWHYRVKRAKLIEKESTPVMCILVITAWAFLRLLFYANKYSTGTNFYRCIFFSSGF